jgi:hypothetical protein
VRGLAIACDGVRHERLESVLGNEGDAGNASCLGGDGVEGRSDVSGGEVA